MSTYVTRKALRGGEEGGMFLSAGRGRGVLKGKGGGGNILSAGRGREGRKWRWGTLSRKPRKKGKDEERKEGGGGRQQAQGKNVKNRVII